MRTAAFCLALLVATADVAAAEQNIPIASFAVKNQYSHPSISPDGKYLAVTVKMGQDDNFVPTIVVYSLPELNILSAMRMPVREVPVDYLWVSNTRLVIEKGVQAGSLEAPQWTGELIAVDYDGKHLEYLYGYKNFSQSNKGERYGDDRGASEIAGVPPARDGHVFLSTYLWGSKRSMLYDINTLTASRKLIAEIPEQGMSFIVQKNGTPRFAEGADQEANDLVLGYDDKTGTWSKLSTAVFGHGFVPKSFNADDTAVYAASAPDGGPYALVSASMSAGERKTIAANAKGDIDLIQWAGYPRHPFAAGSSVGIPYLTYFDPNSAEAKLHKSLSQQFPGSYINFFNETDDGKKLLFSVSSDRDPGAYYLFDRPSGKAVMLFTSMPQIDPEQMAERRPVRFTARDGLSLGGYLTMPKSANGKKPPLILLPHGGPFGVNDEWFFDADAQFLASRGYAVLQLNYRGSGGRGKAFENSGHRQWGGKILDDLVDGVKWAAAQGEVDATRMCVYGASFGGYAALMLAAREPELFKCAIGYAGVYDQSLVYKSWGIKSSDQAEAFLSKTLGTDPAELQRNSPVNYAAKIKVPVMLVHGAEDHRAEVKNADVMRDALVAAGHPPEVWMRVPNEGHGFYATKNVIAFYEAMEGFLAKHLGQ